MAFSVPGAGIEPALPCGNWILNLPVGRQVQRVNQFHHLKKLKVIK